MDATQEVVVAVVMRCVAGHDAIQPGFTGMKLKVRIFMQISMLDRIRLRKRIVHCTGSMLHSTQNGRIFLVYANLMLSIVALSAFN